MLHETASVTVVLDSQSMQSYAQNFKQFRQSCDTVRKSVSTEWLMLLLNSIQVNKHLHKEKDDNTVECFILFIPCTDN